MRSPALTSGIHPEYVECPVRCRCGTTFKTPSTKSEIQVALCNECHPFDTGQQKFVDTGGRVQRFADKFGGAGEAAFEREAATEAAKKAEADPFEEAAAEAEVVTEAAAE